MEKTESHCEGLDKDLSLVPLGFVMVFTWILMSVIWCVHATGSHIVIILLLLPFGSLCE